jgi:hypothetical protein
LEVLCLHLKLLQLEVHLVFLQEVEGDTLPVGLDPWDMLLALLPEQVLLEEEEGVHLKEELMGILLLLQQVFLLLLKLAYTSQALVLSVVFNRF